MATPNKRLDVIKKSEAKRYCYIEYIISPLLSCTKSPYHRVCNKLINSEPIKDSDGIAAINRCVITIANSKDVEEQDEYLEKLRDLLDRGVNPNAPCDNEKNPLCLCAELDCPEAAELLLQSGAHLSVDVAGLNPFEIAIHENSKECLDAFMSYLQYLEGEIEVPEDEARKSVSTPVVYTYIQYLYILLFI